jgi:imidazolonepropionase-like amidohydrolase
MSMRFGLGFVMFAAAVLGPALPAAAETVALSGATLIDGTGGTPVQPAVLLIKDGRIVAAGAEGSVAIPQDARRIDVTGKTIIPGLINAHGHVAIDARSEAAPREQLAAQLRLYARYGVTTVYSLGDDGVESVALADAPLGLAPDRARLFVSGPVLEAASAQDGRADVAANAALGVDMIKIRLEGPPDAPMRTPAVFQAMVDEAHHRELPVAAHIFPLAEAKGLAAAGVDVIAHSVRDQDVDEALVDQMKAGSVGYIPTLTRDLSVFVYESTPEFFSDPFFTREESYRAAAERLTDPAAQARIRGNANAQGIKTALAQAKRNLKILSDAGIGIAMGTDSGGGLGRWQGYFEHLELAMMVESGMTPMQALVAATGGAARVMRLDATFGTLAPGKHADFLVLAANPLDDIRNTRSLEQVWIAGRKLAD